MTGKTPKKESKNIKELNYDNFVKFNIKDSIKKYKHETLKSVCKDNKLKVTGNKTVLSERIISHFEKIKNVIKIQTHIRMYQGKLHVNYRGPAIKQRSLCNNQTDFVTLEPLTDISFNYFFSYKDKNDFIYGFNISSLICHLRTNKKFYNPYNRIPIHDNVKKLILKVYNNNFFIDPEFKQHNKFFYFKKNSIINLQRFHHILQSIQTSNVENYNPSLNIRRLHTVTQMNAEMHERYYNIIHIRNTLSLDQRIEKIFIEIDNLGNYTNSVWFNLTHMQYVRLYRALWDIWTFRGHISPQFKIFISPFYDPFEGIFPNYRYAQNISNINIKTACLIVFENLIYPGIDIEHRKIGALHALSALTLASQNARFALPWLYESLV
tara:strand:- start:19258 stop:20397 length:1140 start_codon:yes stop_codon:yes gene_type:complete